MFEHLFDPPYPYRQSVIANLKTGKAFRGVLWRKVGGYLVLRQATLHERGQATPMDGEVLVPLGEVDFLQIVTPEVR